MQEQTSTTPGSAETFRVARSGSKDLQFEGVLLGRGSREGMDGSVVTVALFATVGGKYITHVERQDVLDEITSRAAVHDTPEQTYEWLLADNGGKLGAASKEAWTEACARWPALAGQDVEMVP